MPARLIIESDQDQTHQELIFDRPRITVGRKAGNDLHFNRAEISGNHAVFLFENNTYYVSDLGSTNGTQLNGSAIVAQEKYPLRHEDVVTISPYRVTFLEDKDMSQTIMETASPELQAELRKAGSGTVLERQKKVSTGTEEHGKRDFKSLIDEDKPGEAQQEAASAAAPAAPAPAAKPTPPPPAPAPAKAAEPAPEIPPAAVTDAEPAPAPGKLGDYAWLAIGGIFVLVAIGLILLVVMML